MASRLKENDSSLAIFVLAVLCKIFSYADYRSILESHLAKRKKENNPPLKYILQQALDALNPNDPEVTKLTAELKCPPLLSHYATLSEWQFGLDKLLNYSKILKNRRPKLVVLALFIWLILIRSIFSHTDRSPKTVLPGRKVPRSPCLLLLRCFRKWMKPTKSLPLRLSESTLESLDSEVSSSL